MLVVGLTGGIGCGKSIACQIFSRLGVPIIDADEISRSLTQIGKPALVSIRKAFGDACFLADGALNRAYLRQRIFSNPEDKQCLENILHPLIRQEVVRQLSNIKGEYVIIAIPLLLETGVYNNLVQRVLLIDCTEQQQIERVVKRNALSESEVMAIMSCQASRQTRIRAADDVIENNDTPNTLELKILGIHRAYLKLSEELKTA